MQTFLIFHLAGAGIVAVLIWLAVMSLFRKNTERYVFYAKTIGFGAAYQLITGSMLAWQSHGTISAFCARIGLYLAVIVISEAVLFFAIRKNTLVFPVGQVAYSLSIGMSAVIVTIFAGVLR